MLPSGLELHQLLEFVTKKTVENVVWRIAVHVVWPRLSGVSQDKVYSTNVNHPVDCGWKVRKQFFFCKNIYSFHIYVFSEFFLRKCFSFDPK